MRESIHIETISTCNLNCIFCPKHKRKDVGRVMSIDTWKVILDQLIEAKIPHIRLTPLIGELFLDPLLWDRLDILEKTNLTFEFYTNLTRLDPKIFKYSNLKSINLSINGHDEKSFTKITNGSPSDFIGVLNSLDHLYENNFFNLIIKIKDNDYDFEENKLKYKMWQKVYRLLVKNPDIYITQMNELDNWASEVNKFEFDQLNIRDITYDRKSCFILENDQIILPDGDILACGCRDLFRNTRIGNIFENTVAEILESKKYKDMLNNLPQMCKLCTFK